MKSKLLSHGSLYMMLSLAILSSSFSIIAHDPQEVQIHLSELEIQEIFNNPTRTYLYLGDEVSKIADVVEELSKLDDNRESLIHGLKNHIEKRFYIANYDAVAQALEYAEELLREKGSALSEEKRAALTRALDTLIDQVADDRLNLDAEILSFMKDSVDMPADATRRVFRLLVIPNKIDVLGKAKFRKDVLFKDHVKIEGFTSVHANAKFKKDVTIEGDLFVEGALSVADGLTVDGTTIGCDITVGCNISMNDSISPTVGNVIKNGVPFIHNFGTRNTFVGDNAGNFTMTGIANTGFGDTALTANTTGTQNVAVGSFALAANTIGGGNTAVGHSTLILNTEGMANVAVGAVSLAFNTTGNFNTAAGHNSLNLNVIGSGNTAVGHNALTANLADVNTAVGVNALLANTTGTDNVALGNSALTANVSGMNNVGLGDFALQNSVSGDSNIAVGFNAGAALTSGSNNIYIGAPAGSAAEAAAIRIGTGQTTTFISGIFGTTTGLTAIPVLVDANGQLGTVSSSAQFKHDIADIADASSAIMKLRPVTFVYNGDATNTTQYGLIAEEVAKRFPGLVVNNADGQPYTVQYHVLPVLLLNEMKKLAARVAVLEARN